MDLPLGRLSLLFQRSLLIFLFITIFFMEHGKHVCTVFFTPVFSLITTGTFTCTKLIISKSLKMWLHWVPYFVLKSYRDILNFALQKDFPTQHNKSVHCWSSCSNYIIQCNALLRILKGHAEMLLIWWNSSWFLPIQSFAFSLKLCLLSMTPALATSWQDEDIAMGPSHTYLFHNVCHATQ